MTGDWLRHFQAPWALAAALLLPVAVVALVLTWARRRAARAARLGERALVARLAPDVVGTRAGWRAVRLGLAAALAGVALAGPRWGLARNVVRSAGIDVVLALDASLSMRAIDERPDRLERMKQEVRRLRALSPGDRTALLAFAGRSYILTPITTDQGALALFLDNLDPSVVGQAGSSMARAIRQATDLLRATESGSDRAIVLMSDGEAFEPVADVEAAAREASEAGVALVTVGFGTAEGARIPVREGNAVTEKRDAEGRIVVSQYRPEYLRAAAEAAGGTFVPADATDKAARVRAALSGLRAQQRALDAGEDLVPRFQLFLAPALALLLLDTLLASRGRSPGGARARAAGGSPEGRGGAGDLHPDARPGGAIAGAAGGDSAGRAARGAARAGTRGAASLLLTATAVGAALASIGACAMPTARDAANGDRALDAYRRNDLAVAVAEYRDRARGGAPLARYNLGTALLAADSLDAARAPLDEARRAPDAELRWRAHFNLGLAHLRRGLALSGDSAKTDLDAALALYRRALLARPGDRDAKWNYELALRKQQEQAGGGGGGGGGESPASPPPDAPPDEEPRPAGGVGRQQAEELLNAAARDERDVQGRCNRRANPPPPLGGKDW